MEKLDPEKFAAIVIAVAALVIVLAIVAMDGHANDNRTAIAKAAIENHLCPMGESGGATVWGACR